MAVWESWPYLFGLELLQDYIPDSKVTIFKQGCPTSIIRTFKEWRGVVSHLYDHIRDGGSASIAVCMNGKIVLVDGWNDMNPTIQAYPFEDLVFLNSKIDRTKP